MSNRFSGAALGYAQIVIKIGIALIFTPILIRSLGQEGYGLFSIVGSMAAYLYLLDFGLNDGVIRFLVRYESSTGERDRFLAQMLGLYIVLGLAVLVLGLGLHAMAEPLFAATIGQLEILLLQDMFLALLAGAVIVIALNPVTALIAASERFVFLRILEIVASIVSTALIVILLAQGFGALMVVIVMACSSVGQVAIRIVYARRYLHMRLRWSLPGAGDIRPVAAYSAPIFVAMLVELIYWKLDNLIIGALAGAAMVAVYAIGVMFNKYFMSFATAISRVMTPEIIRQIDREGGPEHLMELMIRISRLQALLLLLVLSGLFLFGQRFIALWLGSEYAVSYYVMLVVLVPYALELTGNARNILLQVRGLYWYRIAIIAAMALLNIPLTIILLNHYGVIGAAVSTGMCILVSYALVALLLQVKLQLAMVRYLAGVWGRILPGCAISLAAGLGIEWVTPAGWGGLAVGVVLFSLLYGLLMYMFGMNTYERGLLARLIVESRKVLRTGL